MALLTQTVRSLFISDVHLGTRNARADDLLNFLKRYEADVIYLVGDIFDFWKLKRGFHWRQSHSDIVQKLLRRARKGTRIVFIPGNHDEGVRAYAGIDFGGIEVRLNAVHTTAAGKRYLVMHGDEFDVVVRSAKFLALLGDAAYDFAMWLNRPINACRRLFGFHYWSLSAFLKNRVKKAVAFIAAYEKSLVAEAKNAGVEGIICGHIHQAADHRVGDIHYLNCGDWVESATAIIEHTDGRLELVRWTPSSTVSVPASGSLPLAA